MKRLGAILKRARGKQSRVQFARKLGLSYTFTRAMEHGLRFPSDEVLLGIAERIDRDSSELLLAAYADRSPLLAKVLAERGIELPPEDDAELRPKEAGERPEQEQEENERPADVQVAKRF